jgi:hypothetical protein
MVTQRRLRGFNVAAIPAAVRNTILTQRAYTTTWAAVKAYIRNHRTGQTGEDV